ncbi:hypothetical protein EYR40_008726 [Pleurotus pulmonarius]|nr:hypothetical protein EYR36_009548 [Pleurotus pulmonarius]KAF4593929.1 hypothetical protein EYR40_008726 [Pleurotus pulmonarius]
MADVQKQIQIGSFVAPASSWKDVKDGQINITTIARFPTPYNDTTATVTTFQLVDVGNTHQKTWRVEMQSQLSARDSTTLVVGTWADSRLYQATIQWMVMPSSNTDFQSGNISIPFGGHIGRITFPKPFNSQPQVFYTFNKLDISNTWHVNMNVNTITTSGFNYEVRSPPDAVLTSAGVSWVAFTGNLPEVGIYTVQPVSTVQGQSSKGSIRFDKSYFNTPKVFTGLSKMYIGDQYIRFELRVRNVTPAGMDWEVYTWSDTTVHELRLTFLVIGDV